MAGITMQSQREGNNVKTYAGVFVAMTTPFDEKGSVDYDGLDTLIDFYVGSGVAGVVPCGTTGEASTLSVSEHREVIKRTVATVAGRVKVIAGTGANNTLEAIALTRAACDAGADAALVVTPYYNRPPDRGVIDYYEQVAACSTLDIIAYNIPSRTGKNMSAELIGRLALIPALKGVKDGSGDIAQMADLIHQFTGTDFAILTGEDTLLMECCCLGGDGGIMAAAAVLPAELSKLYTLVATGELAAAQRLNKKLRPIVKGLFCESNPIPVKYALHKLFGLSASLRSPMCELDPSKHVFVDALLALLK